MKRILVISFCLLSYVSFATAQLTGCDYDSIESGRYEEAKKIETGIQLTLNQYISHLTIEIDSRTQLYQDVVKGLNDVKDAIFVDMDFLYDGNKLCGISFFNGYYVYIQSFEFIPKKERFIIEACLDESDVCGKFFINKDNSLYENANELKQQADTRGEDGEYRIFSLSSDKDSEVHYLTPKDQDDYSF